MDISYSDLKKSLCPIRHYVELKALQKRNKFSSIVGVYTHYLYKELLNTRSGEQAIVNFNHLFQKRNDKAFEQALKLFHSSLLGYVPKTASVEKATSITTGILSFLNVNRVYVKPDIVFREGKTAAVIEIKTGSRRSYDPLQLNCYSWAEVLNNPYIETVEQKVYWARYDEIATVAIVSREEAVDNFTRCVRSAEKAYDLFEIDNVSTLVPKVEHLIETKSDKLAMLFTYIHPEQCVTCSNSIICPSYHQELSRIFIERVEGSPISDMMSFTSSFDQVGSHRKIVVHPVDP